MNWPRLIFFGKNLKETISANEALEVKKAVCWHAPCYFILLSLLARSWRRPICRETTGISREATAAVAKRLL